MCLCAEVSVEGMSDTLARRRFELCNVIAALLLRVINNWRINSATHALSYWNGRLRANCPLNYLKTGNAVGALILLCIHDLIALST